MADDSDDDLYGENETSSEQKKDMKKEEDGSSGDEPMDEGQDSGDDEDDDSESEIEIIIDKPAIAPKPAAQHHPQESKAIKIEAPPQSSSTPSQAPKAVTAAGTVPQLLPGTAYPAQRTSTIDVNGNPVYPPQGKEILSVDIEADMAEEQKIWRRPGEDQSDYFNYGLDEFAWEMYRQRQVDMVQKQQEQKNEFTLWRQMMGDMPGMPAMPGPGPGQGKTGPAGAPLGPGGGGGGMGPGGMNEAAHMEMMVQHMISQGIDPSQMSQADFMSFVAGQGMGGGFGGPGGQQGGGGFQQQGNHGGGGGRGGRGGRGRGW